MIATIKYLTNFLLAVIGLVASFVTIIAYPRASAFVEDHACQLIIAAISVSFIWIIYSREKHHKNLSSASPKVDDFGGLLKVWHNRDLKTTAADTTNMENSNKIDLLGFTMKNRYLKRASEFDKIIRDKLKRDKQFFLRVVLADPGEEESLRRREVIEDGPRSIVNRLKGDVEDSLFYLNELKQEVCSEKLSGEGCQVRVYLVPADWIFGNLVITDQKILLTSYLFGIRGTGSPTFLIGSKESPLGKLYCDQLEKIIHNAREYSPPEQSSNTTAIN